MICEIINNKHAIVFWPHGLMFTRCHARALPRACCMHVRCRRLIKKNIKKIILRKIVAMYNVFKKKNYSDNLKKKHKKKKKKSCGKTL
jgi:hypothetical protein